jgi:hypothetical protein
MRILRKILFIIAIIVLLIAAIGFLFFPSHIHVDRSVTVSRKPAEAFDYVQRFSNWNKWSPWYERDPRATYTFEGPEQGAGAVMRWESDNKEVGKGSMTITEAKPDSVIRIGLNFMENGVANSSFVFTPEGEGTIITWNFDVEAGVNPLMRILGSFMDGMIGKEYEKGLSNLKTRLEATPVPAGNNIQ